MLVRIYLYVYIIYIYNYIVLYIYIYCGVLDFSYFPLAKNIEITVDWENNIKAKILTVWLSPFERTHPGLPKHEEALLFKATSQLTNPPSWAQLNIHAIDIQKNNNKRHIQPINTFTEIELLWAVNLKLLESNIDWRNSQSQQFVLNAGYPIARLFTKARVWHINTLVCLTSTKTNPD